MEIPLVESQWPIYKPSLRDPITEANGDHLEVFYLFARGDFGNALSTIDGISEYVDPLLLGYAYEHALGVNKDYFLAIEYYNIFFDTFYHSIDDGGRPGPDRLEDAFSEARAAIRQLFRHLETEAMTKYTEIKNFTFKNGHFGTTAFERDLEKASQAAYLFHDLCNKQLPGKKPDDAALWRYRYWLLVWLPINAFKARLVSPYLLINTRYRGHLPPMMPRDAGFQQALDLCLGIALTDGSRQLNSIKGITQIARQSHSAQWMNMAGLWYEHFEGGEDLDKAAKWYALASQYEEEYRSDHERLAQTQDIARRPANATVLALEAAQRGAPLSPALTAVKESRGSNIFNGDIRFVPFHVLQEKERQEDTKAVAAFIEQSAKQLEKEKAQRRKAEEEKLKAEEERRKAEEAKRRAEAEAKRKVEEEKRRKAEREAFLPHLDITFRAHQVNTSRIELRYDIKSRNLMLLANDISLYAIVKEIWTPDGKKIINLKTSWEKNSPIFPVTGCANLTMESINLTLSYSDIMLDNSIESGNKYVLVVETTTKDRGTVKKEVALRKHSLLVYYELHLIRTTKFQLLDYDNHSRKDYVCHNS